MKKIKVELEVLPANGELMESVASEIEQEDPNGASEIIKLYSEDIENVKQVQDV